VRAALSGIAHWFRDAWTFPWRLKAPFLAVLMVLLAAIVAVVATDDRSDLQVVTTAESTRTSSPNPTAEMPASFTEVGPEAIWDPSEHEAGFDQMYRCGSTHLTTCAAQIMEQSGASAQAVAFFRTTGWILADFRETGEVDLGGVLTPFRVNSIGDFVLLNGTPSVFVIESHPQGLGAGIQRDSAYDALAAAFPNLGVWSYDEVFEGFSESPDGTQRFVFQFTLNDGCHACGTGYHARIAFEFAPDGTYKWSIPLGVCNVGYSEVASQNCCKNETV
jgi:hypothetical protein